METIAGTELSWEQNKMSTLQEAYIPVLQW